MTKSLTETQRLFQQAERVAGIGSWELHLDEGVFKASENARRIYGLTGESWPARDIQRIPLPEYRPLLDQAMADLIAGNKPYDIEFKISRPTDKAIIDIHSVAEYHPEKRIIFGIIKDKTRSKQAEAARKESEHRYRLLAENSRDVIWTMSLEGKFTYVSPSVYELRGYTPEEVLRQSLEEAVCSGSIAAIEAGFALAIKEITTGEKQDASVYYEVEQPRKDGTTVWTEVSAGLAYDDGHPSHILGVSRDITARKQVEETVRQSEEKYRLLFNSSNDAVFFHDADGRFVEVNEKACRSLAYSREELLKMRIGDIDDPAARIDQPAIMHQLGTSGEAVFEQVHLTKDRQRIPVELSARQVLMDNRPMFMTVARDITERKKAEAEINRSLSLLTATLEATADGILVVDVDGRVARYSSRFAKMWRIPREILDTGDDGKLLEYVIGQTADPNNFMKRVKELYAQPDMSSSDVIEFKDGRMFERYSRPQRLGGEIVGRVWSFRDVTGRKRLEAQLRNAAEEWRATFDAMATPISIQDRDYKIIRVNKAFAKAMKTTPDKLIGKTCFEVSHGTSEPVHNCPHHKTLKEGVPAEVEIHDTEHGTYTVVSTYPMFGSGGEVIASVHVSQDITERKHLQEQLMVTNRLASVGELAAGIAHEINNPLTGVLGFSELVLSEDIPDNIREDVGLIHSEAQRAADVVKNLLIFARRHPQVREQLNVNEVIGRVLALRAYEAKLNNIEMIAELDPELPEIGADYFQLQQVFLNIVINAEFFMLKAHKRGRLIITTTYWPKPGVVRITFTDDGPGIPPEILERLFDPFFTTKDVGQGTGLGLSISHGVVQQHDGRIWAESEPGNGATFIIELPLNPPPRDNTAGITE
ncbi:PAS domain S-box protein [Dehalogenimonas sp. THU2]|uniref:PAS domain S-box protein n=1 Tax=Dehalogenimonas sp. THU2 TaxID=3151121 RepID=UPI00321834A4